VHAQILRFQLPVTLLCPMPERRRKSLVWSSIM